MKESTKKLFKKSTKEALIDAVKKSLEISSKFTNNATISAFSDL